MEKISSNNDNNKEIPRNSFGQLSNISFNSDNRKLESSKNTNLGHVLDENLDIQSNHSDVKSKNDKKKASDSTDKKIIYNFVEDPIMELSKIDNVILKVQYNECCCRNSSNNLYHVFSKDNDIVNYIFIANELISCKDYSCCDYMSKPFCLNIQHILKNKPKIESKNFATLEKGCTILTCCCFFRPKIIIKYSNQNDICGYITIPCSCGDIKYKVFDKKGRLKYVVDTDCCQPSILCPKNCCGYYPGALFYIYHEQNRSDSIGTIKRIPVGFNEFMRVLDCYQIFFPKSATEDDKFLLI